MPSDWIPCSERLPDEGVEVETILLDGRPRNEQRLTRQGRLWFMDDGVYVYYEPTHWRPVDDAE